MLTIKSYELSEDIFDKILYDFQARIKIVPSTNPYIHGYKNKNDIYYDGREYLICKEYILDYYCHNIENCTMWKQVRIRRVENANTEVSRSIDGQTAWNFIIKLLENYYTYNEIIDVFHKFEAEYDKSYIQYHYYYPLQVNELAKFENCYKYDINGAHTDALVEMFPKAANSILKLYEQRKNNPNYKKYTNFFVGMIKRKGFPKTYNWIVQRTTKILYKAIKLTGGNLLYANTDGYVITAPNIELNTSKKLGEFKLEYGGIVYLYKDKNYWLMQCGDDMKGTCLKAIREKIDLRQNKVVHYNRKRIEINNEFFINVADNVTEEILNG